MIVKITLGIQMAIMGSILPASAEVLEKMKKIM
jgi:hypothetical protein